MIDGKDFAQRLAEQIVSVQPMDEAFKRLYEMSKSADQLRSEGYRPVSRLGLMWIKDKE